MSTRLIFMYNINATNARSNLYKLLDMTIDQNEVVNIATKRGNAVMLSESDYNALMETLYLTSVPGLVRSVRKSAAEPLADMVSADELEW